MTFVNKVQKAAQILRTIQPQLTLRTISSGLFPKVNKLQQTQAHSTGPLSTNLATRQSKTQISTTLLRPYSDDSSGQTGSKSNRLSKVLLASPLIAALPTKAEVDERMEKTILNLVTELKEDIKEEYPDITIEEIKKTLSMDCFADNPTGGAQHLVDFYESIDRSNAAFPDREPVTIADAFTDYKEARDRINRTEKDGVIYLPCFKLTLLPEELKNQAHARELTLYFTRLTVLPDFVGNLHHIEKVEIRGNHFPIFPDCLTKLTKITRLVYNHNRTETLPETFCDLTKLENLDLEKNQISALPKHFGNLSQLQKIDLQHNKLTTLPDSFGSLKKLKECFLKDNQIETLPNTIGGLESLILLELEENQLSDLPDTIGNLSSLEKLYIEKNQLKRLPSNLSGLKNLAIIILSHNNLQQLPDSLGELPNLRQLCTPNNQLKDFPASIAASKSLTGIDLGGNRLTEFNHEMPELQVLLLTKNKITQLPPIEKMPNLTVLSIVKNPIQSLPDNLLGLDGRSHSLNDRMAISWVGAILDTVKVPNRPAPKISVYEETQINGHQFYFIIEDNHPLFQDEPISKL